jgi:hypothetical protein
MRVNLNVFQWDANNNQITLDQEEYHRAFTRPIVSKGMKEKWHITAEKMLGSESVTSQ